jgi:hypothetical protein
MLAVVFASVVDAHDVRMPQVGCQVGLAVESGAVLRVGRHVCREHLQRIATRQPRMLGQIDLAHASRAEQAHDSETGENRTVI